MIQNIIFDMGRVLLDYDPMLAVRPFAEDPETQELLKNTVFGSPEWAQMDRGTLTYQEAELIWQSRLPRELHGALHSIITSWYRFLPAYSDMLALVKRLKHNGYQLYLLSNAGSQIHTYMNSYEAFSYMDGMVISCDWKVCKPEAEIYRVLLREYGLTAESCYFIDDTPGNVEAAKALGFQGYVYRLDMESLVRNMNACGIRTEETESAP